MTFKRLLLWILKEPITNGTIFGMVPGFIAGTLGALMRPPEISALAMMGLGLVFGALFGLFPLAPIIYLTRKLLTQYKGEWGVFVHVVNGKVTDIGNPMWSLGVPPEEIHWISGPRNGGVCRVEGSVPYNITVEIQLRISLTATFEGPFDLQQLWEVTRKHHSSLETWLEDTYKAALKEAEPSFSPSLEGWGRIIWDLSELVKSAKAFDQMAFSNLRSVSAFPEAPRMPRGHLVVRNY